MILTFDKEIEEILVLIGSDVGSKTRMEVAMILAGVLDRGMGMERRRVLDIVARKALNASDLRAEINRPVR